MTRSVSFLAVVVSVCLGWANTTAAGDLFLKSKTVTMVGLADIKAGNTAAGREAAVKQALRKAVEEVVGFVIESSFSAEQKEEVKGGESKFSSKVEEKILTKSSGFIEDYKVLSAKQKGNRFRAVVEVVVKTSSLHQEIAQLGSLLKAVGYPKLVLLIAESYKNKAGVTKQIGKPVAASFIEKELLAKGIELLAQEKADSLRQNAAAFANLVGDDAKIAALATEVGADVALVGISEVNFSGHNEMGQNMFYLSARVSLRAVRGSTGKVLANVENEGRGGGVNETQAHTMAVKKAAPGIADQLLSALVQAWKTELERGNTFTLVVTKVKHYRKVAKPFMKGLEGLPGVKSVKELSFKKKTLELEVQASGSAKELLDAIFESLGEQKKFENLDKTGEDGNRLELTL